MVLDVSQIKLFDPNGGRSLTSEHSSEAVGSQTVGSQTVGSRAAE
jgi:hypothetical protein